LHPRRSPTWMSCSCRLRSLKGVGLLSCLVGMLCVIVSFFWLPLYVRLTDIGGGDTLTGWEFAMEGVKNMMAQGVTPGFLLGISLPFLPVIAAVILGILAIARVVTLHPVLAALFLVVYVFGSLLLLLFFVFLGPFGLLRLGFFGGVLGYALFLVGDLAFRRAAAQAACS